MPASAPRFVQLLVPFVVGLSIVAVAGEAAACLDLGSFCDDAVGWSYIGLLDSEDVAIDGMLLFELLGINPPDPSPAALEMVVTLDGVPVAGAFEAVGIDTVIGWRPAQAFEPARQYLATGSLHNAQPDDRCISEAVPFEFEFSTGSGPMPPLVMPTVAVMEKLVPIGEQSLKNFVCCDGGFAFVASSTCGGGSGQIAHDDGFCAPIESTGTLAVTLDVKVPGDGDGDVDVMLAAGLVVDGVPEPQQVIFASETLRATRSAAFCTEIVLRNLATGATVMTPKQCHGAGVEAQLGPQMLTPNSPVLAEHCKGAPYTCTTMQFEPAWDPMQCAPWPEGGTTGGGPTTSDTGSTTPGSTGTSSADSSPAEDGLVRDGCACASGQTVEFGWSREALLGLLVLGLRRPRRRLR